MISISGLPISPASSLRFNAENVGSKRRWKPIMHGTPARATASTHARARSSDRSTGFSQKIALRAAAARTMRSAWVSVLDAIATAPIAGSRNAVSASTACAACFCASSPAAGALTSTTYLSFTPGCAARLPAWILPMRPAPNSATSIMFVPPKRKPPAVRRTRAVSGQRPLFLEASVGSGRLADVQTGVDRVLQLLAFLQILQEVHRLVAHVEGTLADLAVTVAG